jgi:hypothetical protein
VLPWIQPATVYVSRCCRSPAEGAARAERDGGRVSPRATKCRLFHAAVQLSVMRLTGPSNRTRVAAQPSRCSVNQPLSRTVSICPPVTLATLESTYVHSKCQLRVLSRVERQTTSSWHTGLTEHHLMASFVVGQSRLPYGGRQPARPASLLHNNAILGSHCWNTSVQE